MCPAGREACCALRLYGNLPASGRLQTLRGLPADPNGEERYHYQKHDGYRPKQETPARRLVTRH
ncbi:hypothetical protein D3C73_1530410 [compost metagenome]